MQIMYIKIRNKPLNNLKYSKPNTSTQLIDNKNVYKEF